MSSISFPTLMGGYELHTYMSSENYCGGCGGLLCAATSCNRTIAGGVDSTEASNNAEILAKSHNSSVVKYMDTSGQTRVGYFCSEKCKNEGF